MATESTASTVNPLAALRFAAGTDIGLRREENQDAHGIVDGKTFRAFFVCDGMGGVQGGAIASNLAISTIRDFIKDLAVVDETEIASAITQANANIFERGGQEPGLAGMGTTCVGLVFTGERMLIANVGDSRAYRIRHGQVEQLTEDHTLVQELVRSGALAPEAAGNHPVSHMLTRSLGPAPTVEVDCRTANDGPARGDVYLICCDGLYNMLGAEEFVEILENFSIDDAVQEFIDLANLRGGTDNITLIVIEVGPDYPVGPERFGGSVESPPANGAAAESASSNHAEAAGEPAANSEHASPEDERADVGDDESDPIAAAGATTLEEKPTDPRPGRASQSAAVNTEAAEEPFESGVATVSIPERVKSLVRAIRLIRPAELLSNGLALLLVLGLGFGIGYLYSHSSRREDDASAVVSRIREAQQAGDVETEAVAPNPNIAATVSPMKLIEEKLAHSSGSDAVHSNDSSERERLKRRHESLQKTVADLDAKIASFNRPISGKLGETLDMNRKAIEQAEAGLESTRADLDMATRKLAVWYGRRKRLQETDPINLASEVAVAAGDVRKAKENFEHATWAYLKEAEVLRYDPANKRQIDKVAALGRERTERMADLVQAIRTAIEREVGQADRRISELTVKRDEKESELVTLRREVEYVKILMGADANARAAKKAELQREREVVAAELEGLSTIFGTDQNDYVPFQ